jgi:transposase, IS30 family
MAHSPIKEKNDESVMEPGVPRGPEGRLGGRLNSAPGGARLEKIMSLIADLHYHKSSTTEMKRQGNKKRRMDNSRKRIGVKHLTYEDRVGMETLIKVHWPQGRRIVWTELGRLMGRSWRSVQREYMRGRVINKDTYLREYWVYSARKGQAAADAACADKGPRMKLTNKIAERLRRWIVEERCSPYVAVKRMHAENREAGSPERLPGVRSVYYAIGRGDLEIIRANLPYGAIEMKPRRQGRRMAYTRPKGRSITDRPAASESREEYGHWEMDTVVGSMQGSGRCLLVLTERKTRVQIIRPLPDRTQRSVIRALNGLERRQPDLFASMKSLTSDNGGEFWDFEAIERSVHEPSRKRCSLYYAHPFCAFERGTNENNNRLIRRFIPKGADLADYSRKEVQTIEDWINRMERESLGGISAAEAQGRELNETAA